MPLLGFKLEIRRGILDMKRNFILSGIFVGGLLLTTGCAADNDLEPKAKVAASNDGPKIEEAEVTEEGTEETVEGVSVEQKIEGEEEAAYSTIYSDWVNKPSDEEFAEHGLPLTLQEYVAEANEAFKETPTQEGGGLDEGYDMYLKSEAFDEFGIYKVEGAIKKDIQNLFKMHSVIGHLQFVRTSHIDGNGGAKEDLSTMDDWKAPDEEMFQAYEYMVQIVHDLDVALNHNGEGKLYGVTYHSGGDKVEEVDKLF